MNYRISALIWLISLCARVGGLSLASDINSASMVSLVPAVKPVTVEFFNEPGCEECAMVNDQILPEFEQRYRGCYILARLDLGVITNYLRLVSYQKKLGEVNAPVYMVLGGKRILSGFKDMKANLFVAMDQVVSGQVERVETAPPAVLAISEKPDVQAELTSRMKQFTLAGILLAGLLDALNPCAMATIVFFMSLLSAAGVRGRRILLAGSAFAVGCFMTYTALGFGVLRVIHLFEGFHSVKLVANTLMVAMMVLLAILSLRDALRYGATHNPRDISVKLPFLLMRKGHQLMKDGMGHRSIVIGGLVTGVVVTALESVCTGQIYIPTLVMLIKCGGGYSSRAIGYLVAYNLMFVLPLVILFILVYQGLKWQAVLEWSKRNVVVSKILMGLFFLVMAVMMVLMG
jgi:cytochrome c biogenesis protein CcdA